MASDEAHNGYGRMDAWKRERLSSVGADVVIRKGETVRGNERTGAAVVKANRGEADVIEPRLHPGIEHVAVVEQALADLFSVPTRKRGDRQRRQTMRAEIRRAYRCRRRRVDVIRIGIDDQRLCSERTIGFA